MSTTTISPIEFATNSKGNWFTVSYDWNQCNEILTQARKLGVIPSAPRKYTYPNTRWIIYFNSGVNDNFMKWVRTTFSVQNVQRVVGAMRSEAALKYENKTYCQRATISRYPINEVKTAMLNTIGTAAEIRELFDNYNIKVVGVAGLPQCLQLIEELDKFDAVIAELRKPKPEPELGTELAEMFKAVDEIMSKPIYQDTAIVPYVETVEAEIVEDDEIEIDTEEFINALVGAYINQYALPAGVDKQSAYPSDFDPHTVEELNQRSVTKEMIVKICAEHGIDVDKKTQRLNKLDLINHILPALNAAALAAHLA
jgi:hypothetical protein